MGVKVPPAENNQCPHTFVGWRAHYAATMIARRWHAAIAIIVCVALALQIVIAAHVPGSPHDVGTGLLRGSSLPGRIIRVFSFFTVQSNLLSGIVSAQLAARRDRDGPVWRAFRLAALLGITVTGIVYSTVLAQIHEPNGFSETLVTPSFTTSCRS